MIDTLLKHFEHYIALNSEEKDYIKANIPVKTFNKNYLLLSENEVSNEFYFVINGLVRLYYNVGLEEKTAYFYTENTFVSSYESFTKQCKSKHNLETLEETTLAIISFEVAYKLLELFPKFEFLARIMMEEELIMCQDIIASFVTSNAENRYLNLMKRDKDLLQRIPQYHLATFLGVTPETLSRIRKRITSR
ncbi:Crp/Fnr family transcriptional regulator [Psychroserpens luteolus]|uniref:Crp/Fnr family transcriptional regulator n=1 Tax=Psychroserpens luteolus TaxID=2855840 RepID=UPI001E3284F0|nr:Crp/Fnr family transcriptional regulator [Psychroserpens luteolus]MCD2259507.1 Crp/Fnr family transcriptional regulator [Psychroserpens luteolus]